MSFFSNLGVAFLTGGIRAGVQSAQTSGHDPKKKHTETKTSDASKKVFQKPASQEKTGKSSRFAAGCSSHQDTEATAADIAEHIGNGEFGSAARDLIDYTRPALQDLGREIDRETGTNYSEPNGDRGPPSPRRAWE